jgi:hypothetical protein
MIGEMPISTHLNSHEAMATGSAFHAANGSFQFRARPILLSDGLNMQVNLQIQTLNDSRKVETVQIKNKFNDGEFYVNPDFLDEMGLSEEEVFTQYDQ